MQQCVLVLSLLLCAVSFQADAFTSNPLYSFGPGTGDSSFDGVDDGFATVGTLTTPYTLYGTDYTSVFAGSNGQVSFNSGSGSCCGRTLPTTPPLVTAFWSDINPQTGGVIYHRVINGGAELMTLRDRLVDISIFGPCQQSFFTPSSAAVVTYDQVSAFGGSTGVFNTFQVIFMTDGATSYTVFLYNSMNWGMAPTIGFNDGTNFYTLAGGEGVFSTATIVNTLPTSSNIGVPGVFVFRTQSATIEPGTLPPVLVPLVGLIPYRDTGTQLPATDDGTPMCYNLAEPFLFLGETYMDICVDPNGLISFGGVFRLSCCPRDFPLRKDPPPLFMPFWSDVNAQLGGEIWSRIAHSPDETSDIVCRMRVQAGAPENFAPTNILLATWFEVAEYQTANTDRNTFQVALASDGVQSYVIIEYDTIQWTGNAQIGVSSGDRFSTGPPVDNDTMLLDLTQTQVALPITDALPPPPPVATLPPPTGGPTTGPACDPYEIRMDNIIYDFVDINGREIYTVSSTVEVCIGEEFYTICGRGWSDDLADVACQTLNSFGTVLEGRAARSQLGHTISPVFRGYISCPENATNFNECNFTRDDEFELCDPITNNAGMICSEVPDSTCFDGNLRLSDRMDSRDPITGYHVVSGRVEICFNGEWSAICDNDWDVNDARVGCNRLGFPTEEYNPTTATGFGPYVGPVSIDGVQCTGLESNPLNCSAVVPPVDPACQAPNPDPSRLAGLTCTRYRRQCSSPGVDQIFERSISNYDESSSITVRVLLCDGALGQYLPLCADGFDDDDATVYCRNYFGPGWTGTSMNPGFTDNTAPFLLQRLECDPRIHDDLLSCPTADRDLPPTTQCTVATAVCRSECQYDGQTRIAGGSPYSGRVEVCEDGQWTSICDDDWDDYEADGVCIEREFLGGERGTPFDTGPRIAITNLTCPEDDPIFSITMRDCNFTNTTQVPCTSGARAAVNCQPASLDLDIYPVGEEELWSDRFRMHCGAYQYPWNAALETFEWRRNGRPLRSDDTRTITELNNGYDDGRLAYAYNSSMQFFPLSPRDAGLYFCDASINVTYPDGPENTTISNSNRSMGYMLNLRVDTPVAWIREEGLLYFNQSLNLSCFATFPLGVPEEAIMITWWADGQRVTEQYPRRQISGLVQLDEQTYMRNLSYNTLWLSDTSDLYCIASVLSTYLYSDRAAVPYDLFVQIMSPVPVISEHPRGGDFLVGDEVTFDCRASGEGDLNYYWFFEDSVIVNETSYQLNISEVEISHRGYYHCLVSNDNGMVESERALLRLRDVRSYYVRVILSDKYPPSLENLALYLQMQRCVYRDQSVNFENIVIPPGADDSLVMLLSAVDGRWPELEFLQYQLDSVAQEFGHGVEFIRRVDICPVDTEDNYNWPEQELSEIATISCRCGAVDTVALGLEAVRMCTGNYSSLMAVEWSDAILNECDSLNAATCDATNGGGDRVFDYLDNLPRLDPEDISVVGSFLSGVVDSDQLDAEADNFLRIIDRVLQGDPGDILTSHEDTKSSAIYLNALDRFVNRVDLGGETNRKFEQSEFGIHIVEQDARDFNGITFSAVADVNDPETTITVFADVFNTPPLEGAAAAATLTLPPSLVRDLELVGSLQDLDVMIRYNFAAHLNDFFFQHRNNSRPFDEFDGLEIGGIFISAFLRDLEVEDLPENVTISFTKSEEAQSRGRARCVFWDQELDNGFGGLSDRGCYVAEDGDTQVTCLCNHLTAFTIITEVSTEIPFEFERSIFNYVMLGVSLLILLLTMLLTLAYAGLRKSYRSGPLFFSCLWLVCLYIIFIISRSVDLLPNPLISQYVLGALTHLFINLHLCWTVSNALLMLVMAHKIRSRKYRRVFNLVSFFANLFISLLFTGVAMIGYDRYSCRFFCRPYEEPLWYDLVIGTGILYVTKMLLYLITLFYLCISTQAVKTVAGNVIISMLLSFLFLAYLALGLAGSSAELYRSLTGSALLFAFSGVIFIHALLTLLLHTIDGARVTDDENTPNSLSGGTEGGKKKKNKGQMELAPEGIEPDQEVGAVHNPMFSGQAATAPPPAQPTSEATEMNVLQEQQQQSAPLVEPTSSTFVDEKKNLGTD